MKSDRRFFLASLGAAGFLSACSSAKSILPGLPGGSPSNARVRSANPLMPLQIVNKSGYPDKDVWFYVVGQNELGPNKPNFHMIDASGAVKKVTSADEHNGFYDFSIRLSDIANGDIHLPNFAGGGRMYFSIKDKLKIPNGGTGPNPVPGSPPGWVAASPNYPILFDNWEFTQDNTDVTVGFNYNATQVDMYGFSIAVRGIGFTEGGQKKDKTIGFPAGVRDKILGDLKALKAFKNLVIKGTLGDVRAIAPNLGIDPASNPDGKTPLFSPTYFDAYVDRIWTNYKTKTLSAKTSQGVYVGRVDSDGFFVFSQAGKENIYFAKPTTKQVFECNMQPFCGTNTKRCTTDLAAIEIKGALPTAINRGFLPKPNLPIIPGEPPCVNSLKTAYSTTPNNEYSAILHKYAIDGHAYGFGNDDVCAGSSYVAIRKPTRAVVTLNP